MAFSVLGASLLAPLLFDAVIDHLIPIADRFSTTLAMIRSEMLLAVFGQVEGSMEYFSAVPFFLHRDNVEEYKCAIAAMLQALTPQTSE